MEFANRANAIRATRVLTSLTLRGLTSVRRLRQNPIQGWCLNVYLEMELMDNVERTINCDKPASGRCWIS